MPSSLETLRSSILSLGPRRLAALGIAALATIAAVMLASFLLSKPANEAVYVGLEPDDVSRIGAALQEFGIAFDANAENTAVYVAAGEAARARMLLAAKGLPQSDRAGYELFDNLGSLGLTSFMQQVTRVRALEGELARTIQLIDGVKVARVHIVMPKEGAFRTEKSVPTASIVIRTSAGYDASATRAIKHLVAAAVPSLTTGEVTVLSTDGVLLSAGDEAVAAAPQKMVELERSISADLQDKISRTLAPFLGVDNYRVSVSVKLNADRSEVNETKFDPESRVERSVRTIKETGEAENANSDAAVSVDQNVPQEVTPGGGGGESSKEKKDRREELTNYEINTRTTQTVSDGYRIEALSVALIVNKAQLATALGANPQAGAVEALLKEIKDLATSAAGLNSQRGDQVTVTTADFLALDVDAGEDPGESITATLMRHLGSMVNAVALIVTVLLVLLFGLRPALRQIVGRDRPEAQAEAAPAQLAAPSDSAGALPSPQPATAEESFAAVAAELLDTPQTQKLSQIVALDTERAARILKAWLNEPEGALR